MFVIENRYASMSVCRPGGDLPRGIYGVGGLHKGGKIGSTIERVNGGKEK